MILNSLFNSIEPLPPKICPSPPKLKPSSLRPPFVINPIILFSSKSSLYNVKCCQWTPIKACKAEREIDMVKTKEGIYTAKPKKVVVLWDLDNKPPRGPPYQAALALKGVAQKFGEVIDISAYANHHAFIHLPQWVLEERRERRQMDFLERKGLSTPTEPYICSVCGRKCKTNFDLKKHFRQLHERERQKKLNRMRSLKGKKRQRYKERFINGNEKYNETARRLLTPKVGYGLAQELRRAGVYVKTVEDKPQAADWALKRQIQHSMSRSVDWMVLVSDDSDFSEMLRKAREANLGTVVVGDQDRSLGRHADIWVPWIRVENGEIKENDLELKSKIWREFDGRRGGSFSVSEFDGGLAEENLDELVGRMELDDVRISSFSEVEEGYEEDDDWIGARLDKQDNVNSIIYDDGKEGDYLLYSEDEELEEADDAYF
ncbi:PIN domain-like containing [Olea europaea subsp. europaea]|uniref:PIN domain-like containing n=1 Tax=Olea europaea subsp. europaea TaxID=158383 RepID=A0A8S0Q835_OLEEU|nr:PIN domain-like containing [Olea europaea subsp. europaea]